MCLDAAPCPNCGGRLETHRREAQPAGRRYVHLHWVICTTCRHVVLHKWSFEDDQSPVTATPSSGRQPK
jgi:uncharacterized CHY-type Zn-finger protein